MTTNFGFKEMASSGGGGAGALRVKAKLKAALKNGNFYEAHQMYR